LQYVGPQFLEIDVKRYLNNSVKGRYCYWRVRPWHLNCFQQVLKEFRDKRNFIFGWLRGKWAFTCHLRKRIRSKHR